MIARKAANKQYLTYDDRSRCEARKYAVIQSIGRFTDLVKLPVCIVNSFDHQSI
jgi:hypothetical protein